jgi:hypothetical protein
MRKNQRAASSDVKIAAALKAMMNRYSFTEYKKWVGNDIASEFKLGAAFPMALVQLGVIETKRGEVKLNERINHLRPSTVRKSINKYVNGKAKQSKIKNVKQPTIPIPQSSIGFDDLVIALKAKLKQEVMNELLASLK